MNAVEIGKKLRELRHSKGVQMQTICDATGISLSALGMYECGKRIPRDEIKIKLAAFFGVSVDFLFFSDDCSRKVTEGEIA